MENASRAFLDAVRRSMRQIRVVIGATTIDATLLTATERLQYDGYLRRKETDAAILALSKTGDSIKQIMRRTGHGRQLVRQVIHGERYAAWRRMKWRFEPRSLRFGLTHKPKVRSRASSSSGGKCTVEGKSICFKPD